MPRRAGWYWLAGLWWIAGAAWAAEPVRVVPGPEDLPRVSPEMRTADFWIGRLEAPDEVLVSAGQAQAEARAWQQAGYLIDVFSLPDPVPRELLREWLRSDIPYLRRVGLYGRQGQRLGEADYRRIIDNLALAKVRAGTPLAFGLAVRRTPLRLFPTEETATAKPLDLEFNQLVHTALRFAEPVAILHASQDQRWWFVAAEAGRGWVLAEDIARAPDPKMVREYALRANVKIVDRTARLRGDDGALWTEAVEMGCELAPGSSGESVLAPRRKADGGLSLAPARVEPSEAAAAGGWPCTRRNLLILAFRLLDAPYGWGGESGFGDCSEIIRRMGLACGLRLPRSTADLSRALAGEELPAGPRAKAARLAAARGGADLILLPGHVMLAVGTVEGRLFVVHNLYGIQARDADGDFIRRLARVVVSDLSLGAGSRKGSLEQRASRLLSINRQGDAGKLKTDKE
ncbi:MAG: SH3 domain-containing protein [candidate division FCPU426 bacterium]